MRIAEASFLGDSPFKRDLLRSRRDLPLSGASAAALRVSSGAPSGGPPFFALRLLGTARNLRGDETGPPRGRAMLAVQAAWRWRLHQGCRLVAFAGRGAAAPHLSAVRLGRGDLPSFRRGVRFVVGPQHGLTVGVDDARGRDSDAWQVQVGETF